LYSRLYTHISLLSIHRPHPILPYPSFIILLPCSFIHTHTHTPHTHRLSLHSSLHPLHPSFHPPISLTPQGLQGPSCATNTHMRAFPPNMVSTAVRFPSLRDAVLGVRSSDSSARNSIRIRSPRSSSQADSGTGTGVAHSARYFSEYLYCGCKYSSVLERFSSLRRPSFTTLSLPSCRLS
jgi:hypothetical protein